MSESEKQTGCALAGPAHAVNDAELAVRLHSAAIRLLRRLRHEDDASGLSAPQLSALSVIVHAGPLKLGELASKEQVRPASMSAIVKALHAAGLVARKQGARDRRTTAIAATDKGAALLEQGRKRRTDVLSSALSVLPDEDARRLADALPVIEALARRPE